MSENIHKPIVKDTIAVNIHKPIIKVFHCNLKRLTEESTYKSHCPVCKEGMLLLSRDKVVGYLLDRDICINCGQTFIYKDIKDLWEKDI